jgi:pyruvate/2-oxoglutarate dehydrogenase complex dihydrolipoamide acyltransferase (E2) component
VKASRSVPITLPDLGSPARFSLWLVQPGERVYEGDRVAEVLIPGAAVDIHAPASGSIVEELTRRGDTLVIGQVLGRIEVREE